MHDLTVVDVQAVAQGGLGRERRPPVRVARSAGYTGQAALLNAWVVVRATTPVMFGTQ